MKLNLFKNKIYLRIKYLFYTSVMGIQQLNYFLKIYAPEAIKIKHLSTYKNKTIAIDANVYLYKFLYKNNHLNGLFFQIYKLQKYNIKPIFIFDGKPPEEKLKTINIRTNNKQFIKNQIIEMEYNIKNNYYNDKKLKQILKKIDKLKSKLIYVNKDVINKSIELFKLMGIHYIMADCEAEHYCAKLNKLHLVDLVLSEDMDTICCGSSITLRNYSNKSDFITEYNFELIINKLNINHNQFIDLCILFGNDYIKVYKNKNVYENYLLILKYINLKNILSYDNYILNNIQNIQDIYKLKNIIINCNDIFEITSFKKPQIKKLKKFIKNNTNIDKKIYEKILYKKQIFFKNICLKNNYYLKLIQK